MNTLNNFRQYFPVLMLATAMSVSTVEVSAQNNRKEGKKENGHERKEYQESERRDDLIVYKDRRDDREGNYGRKDWNDRENNKVYRPKYYNRNKHYESDYYQHPRYGRVYERFDRNPLVFHHDRDDYYYYGNHFYSYRKGVGYCVVDAPRNVYFRELPVDCERVQVNGNVLFRNGDLYFQLSRRGYALVNLPGISISARF
jgi:hypothetical protein